MFCFVQYSENTENCREDETARDQRKVLFWISFRRLRFTQYSHYNLRMDRVHNTSEKSLRCLKNLCLNALTCTLDTNASLGVKNSLHVFMSCRLTCLKRTPKTAFPNLCLSADHLHLLKSVYVPLDLITFFLFLTCQQIK